MKTDLFPELIRPIIIAHRGYSALAPENTMSAFQTCIVHHVTVIELDIHLCASGELVVIHDHSLKRVSGLDGIVEDMHYSDLGRIDVGSWFSPEFSGERIPLLREVFDAFGSSCYFDIELKSRNKDDFGLALSTCKLIKEFQLEQRVMVSSFNPLQIRYIEKHSRRTIPTAVIYADDPEVPKLLRRGFGKYLTRCSALKPEYEQINERNIRRMKKRYHVFSWTVDDPQVVQQMAACGVDGIICNDPVQVGQMLTKWKAE